MSYPDWYDQAGDDAAELQEAIEVQREENELLREALGKDDDPDELHHIKIDKPEKPKAPAKTKEPTEAELDEIYSSSTSDEELHRRLREAGLPMRLHGQPVTVDGRVDLESPRYDMAGKPLNDAALAKFRERNPEYVAAEAEGPSRVVDGIGRVTYE